MDNSYPVTDKRALEMEQEVVAARMREALEVMRGFMASPIGMSDDRDKRVRDIWMTAQREGR